MLFKFTRCTLLLCLYCALFNTSFAQLPSKTKNPNFSHVLDSIFQWNSPQVTVAELIELKKKGVVLLDVREKNEFEVSHIRHAQHVSALWFDMRELYDFPKDTTIIVYCSVGNRAARITDRIRRAGYPNVYLLYGGIFEWVNQRNPIYRKDGVQTTEIHAYQPQWIPWIEYGSKVGI
jgi:rhodanese-related sulfurtransferase